MKKISVTIISGIFIFLLSMPVFSEAGFPGREKVRVGITHDLVSVDVLHDGKKVTIRRAQDRGNRISLDFALTSRDCPPYCIQPMTIAPGVETIGEIEVLDYLKRQHQGDDSILVIDSRGPKWLANGTISGSVSIFYKKLMLGEADEEEIADILEYRFGAIKLAEFWDFSNVKTLVFFCNGMWCGQSPTNIRSLLKIGYPADKLKWYRGGMQSWEALGLTTVISDIAGPEKR